MAAKNSSLKAASNIHRSALIHRAAIIEEDVAIGPFTIIGQHVKIGAGTIIAGHAIIESWTEIGSGCSIGHGALLGLEAQHRKCSGGRSYLKIGNGNIIREYVTIHRSAQEEGITSIGDNNFIMAYCHVGHDCKIGDGVVMTNYTGLSGHVEVQDGAVLSGYVGVHQFARIGRLAMVSGQTGLTKDVVPYVTVQGRPPRVRGLNVEGLRRSGMSEAQRGSIKAAYKLIFRSGLNVSQALEALMETGAITEDVRGMVDFIKASKRGIYR